MCVFLFWRLSLLVPLVLKLFTTIVPSSDHILLLVFDKMSEPLDIAYVIKRKNKYNLKSVQQ